MNATKPILVLALGFLSVCANAQTNESIPQASTGVPTVNATSSNARDAAVNPMAFRPFAERPTVAISPVMIANPDGPTAHMWDVESLPEMPSNFPMALDAQKGERSKTFVPTYLTVRQTYRARFDNYKSQVFDITTPVYYDDRYLQLNAQDQKLLVMLEAELKGVLSDMEKSADRAEQLSKDLVALYARGRPTKLLRDYTPVQAYGQREQDKTAFQLPLLQALPTSVKE